MHKKTFFTLILGLFISTPIFSQAINFDSRDWKTIVARAKAEKKMIFVDFYTTWCGPCKRLEKEVFSLPEVGRKFNNSFINVRINAEAGEGIELASTFNVSAYPTSLFIKAEDETPVYKIVGFLNSEKYLEQTDAALDALVKDPLTDLEFEYQSGNRTIALLNKMIARKMDLNRPIDREVEAFFITHWVDSFFVKSNERLFRDIKLDVNGRAFELLMQRIGQVNQSAFYTLQPSIKQLVEKNFLRAVKNASKKRDEASLERILNYAPLLWTYPNLKNPEISHYQMLFYQHGDDPEKLVTATREYMTKGYLMTSTSIPQMAAMDARMKSIDAKKLLGNVSDRMTLDSAQLNNAKQSMLASSQSSMALYYAKEFVSILQPYLAFVKEPKAFRLAKEWSKRLTELDDNPYNLSIHAQILYKAEDKIEAIAVQKIAIEKAKKEKYSEKDLAVMTDFLNEINR